MLRVRVEAPLQATESAEKVSAAIRNLFPDVALQAQADRVVGTTETLDRLRDRIRSQRIRDTARRQFLAGRHGDRTVVDLNKQAAFVGVVSFGTASPLGDIRVEIESDDLSAVIDDVAESTVEPKAKT
ncbi:MAG TPA: RNA-binding domain-containing protein [Thermoplasmata archaeon]